MGKAHLEHVRQKRLGKFQIANEPVPLLDDPSPRSEMHLVDADRSAMPLLLRTLGHPFRVRPLIAVEIVNHRRGLHAMLTEESERIALQQKRPGLRLDLN